MRPRTSSIGPVRGDELPEQLASREGCRAWLRDAKQRLERGRAERAQPVPRGLLARLLVGEGNSHRRDRDARGFFGRYMKVNRLLTEGRQAFLRRVSGIERGAECARYEPLLSALADGEASAEQLAILRPHMRTCLSCRARLREFRATPERVAALVPPAALVVSDGGGPLRSLAESMVGLGDRVHAAAELATGQKLAAVAASAAALAGGGTAIDEFATHQGPPLPAHVQQAEPQPVKEEVAVDPAPPPAEEAPPTDSAPAPEPPPPPAPNPSPPPPDPAAEFAPGAAPEPAAASEPAAAPPPQRADNTFAPASGGGGGSASGSGEFSP
jgi:hypothetical protein